MKKAIRLISLHICCLLLFFSWKINSLEAQNFSFKNFSVQEGLTQSQVYALCQDKRGVLWLGTRGGGLCSYDGKSFQHLNKKNGLLSNTIDALLFHADQLYCATPDGVHIIDPQTIKRFPVQFKNLTSSALLFHNKEIYWVSSKGLFVLRNNNVVQLDSMAWVSGCVHEGKIYLATKNTLYTYAMGKFDYLVSLPNTDIQTIATYNNKLLIGTYGSGLFIYQNKQFLPWLKEQLKNVVILHCYTDQLHQLVLSTLNHGVLFLDAEGHLKKQIQEKDGLCKNHIRCTLQDNEGNYWFGSSGNGLSYYSRNQFKHWDQSSGLPGNFIYAVYRDRKNRLWVGADARGVTCIRNDSLEIYDAKYKFGNYKVRAICEDQQGRLFFGTEGYGTFVFENDQFKPLFSSNKNYIRAMCCNAQNEIFMATADKGILKVSTTPNGNFITTSIDASNGLKDNRTSYVYCDRKNQLWFATEQFGLGRILPKDSILYFPQLPNHSKIRTLCEDRSGQLWCATESDGVFVVNEHGEVQWTDVNAYLQSGNIYQLGFLKNGALVIGTESGMDMFTLTSSNKVKEYKHYTRGDGFKGIETNLNALYCYENKFFSGTIHGMEEFTGGSEKIQHVAPIPFIRQVRINFEPIALQNKNPYQLNYKQNRIWIDFDATSLANAEHVAFSWRLVGYDDHWTPANKEHNASFQNLSPGEYTFELKACNQDSVWAKHSKSLQFIIHPVWWQRVWVKWTAGILLLIGLWIAYKMRIRQVKVKADKKLEQLRMQNELVQLEHTAMRLQMNPHFIFNALNSIQSVIGKDRTEDARFYMAKFSKLMRQILNNSLKSEITLEEEIETLTNYLLIEQFTNSIPFNFSIETSEDIDKDFITLPPMIVQPFVENALKHGLRHLTNRKGEIAIRFYIKDHILHCTVSDNGIGVTASQRIQSESKEPKDQSVAIDVTRKRLQLLHPKNEIIIRDKLSDEQSQGTEVSITFHLNENL